MGIVYIATNRENGKQYIGYTSRTLSQRIREHKSHTKNSIFHSALRKYGIEMFQFEKLYESDDLFLLDLRQGYQNAQWISVPVLGKTPGRRYGHSIAFSPPYLVIFGGNVGSEPTND